MGNAKSSDASSSGGGCCGMAFGCFIIIAAVSAVLFFFVLLPRLQEDETLDLRGRFAQFRTHASALYEKWERKFGIAGNAAEKLKDSGEKIADQAGEITETVTESVNEWSEEPQVREEPLPTDNNEDNE